MKRRCRSSGSWRRRCGGWGSACRSTHEPVTDSEWTVILPGSRVEAERRQVCGTKGRTRPLALSWSAGPPTRRRVSWPTELNLLALLDDPAVHRLGGPSVVGVDRGESVQFRGRDPHRIAQDQPPDPFRTRRGGQRALERIVPCVLRQKIGGVHLHLGDDPLASDLFRQMIPPDRSSPVADLLQNARSLAFLLAFI